MTLKRIYSCNLCHEAKEPRFMWGFRFANMHKFQIGAAELTEGTHVCGECMLQIKKWCESLDTSVIPSYRFEQ